MTDIIAAIDAVTGCQQCGRPLGASPSDDFCGQDCQAAWSAARTQPLVGYREPWEFGPEDYEASEPPWTMGHEPRPEVDGWRELSWADLVAMPRGELDALTAGRLFVADPGTRPGAMVGGGNVVFASTTSDSRGPLQDVYSFYALLAGDGFELASRQQAGFSALWGHHTAGPVEVTFEPVEVNWGLMHRYYGIDEPVPPHEPEGPADPRERALWSRRNRNTGPARRVRPPRTVNARRSR